MDKPLIKKYVTALAIATVGIIAIVLFAGNKTEEPTVRESLTVTPIIEPLTMESSEPLPELTAEMEIPYGWNIDAPQATITPSLAPEDEACVVAQMLEKEFYMGDVEGKVQGVWVVINRVESGERYFPDDIISGVTQKNQFLGWNPDIIPSDESLEIAFDVLTAWYNQDYSTRELDPGTGNPYLYFEAGANHKNVFRSDY